MESTAHMTRLTDETGTFHGTIDGGAALNHKRACNFAEGGCGLYAGMPQETIHESILRSERAAKPEMIPKREKRRSAGQFWASCRAPFDFRKNFASTCARSVTAHTGARKIFSEGVPSVGVRPSPRMRDSENETVPCALYRKRRFFRRFFTSGTHANGAAPKKQINSSSLAKPSIVSR